MKAIKISGGTIRQIDDADLHASILLHQIIDVVTEHRNNLINRVMHDLVIYLDYHFKKRVTLQKLTDMKNSLLSMRQSRLDMTRYQKIVLEILETRSDVFYIKTEPFYAEINEQLIEILNPHQLELVRD